MPIARVSMDILQWRTQCFLSYGETFNLLVIFVKNVKVDSLICKIIICILETWSQMTLLQALWNTKIFAMKQNNSTMILLNQRQITQCATTNILITCFQQILIIWMCIVENVRLQLQLESLLWMENVCWRVITRIV